MAQKTRLHLSLILDGVNAEINAGGLVVDVNPQLVGCLFFVALVRQAQNWSNWNFSIFRLVLYWYSEVLQVFKIDTFFGLFESSRIFMFEKSVSDLVIPMTWHENNRNSRWLFQPLQAWHWGKRSTLRRVRLVSFSEQTYFIHPDCRCFWMCYPPWSLT